MRLSDFLDPALVLYNLAATGSRDLLSQISERVCAQHPDLDKKVLLSKLQEREDKSWSPACRRPSAWLSVWRIPSI